MREAAVMLLLKNDNGLKILAVSRRYDKTKFGLPGGKLEPNETPKDAAIRECFEETGVKVVHCCLIYRRDEMRDRPEGEDFHTYCYYGTKWEGEPHNSEEGEVAWLSEEELTGDKGAFPEYNRKTLDMWRKIFVDETERPIGE
jgi:8-oxo-dGTP pyrophosphatase MutT (NUDIX family)